MCLSFTIFLIDQQLIENTSKLAICMHMSPYIGGGIPKRRGVGKSAFVILVYCSLYFNRTLFYANNNKIFLFAGLQFFKFGSVLVAHINMYLCTMSEKGVIEIHSLKRSYWTRFWLHRFTTISESEESRSFLSSLSSSRGSFQFLFLHFFQFEGLTKRVKDFLNKIGLKLLDVRVSPSSALQTKLQNDIIALNNLLNKILQVF